MSSYKLCKYDLNVREAAKEIMKKLNENKNNQNENKTNVLKQKTNNDDYFIHKEILELCILISKNKSDVKILTEYISEYIFYNIVYTSSTIDELINKIKDYHVCDDKYLKHIIMDLEKMYKSTR